MPDPSRPRKDFRDPPAHDDSHFKHGRDSRNGRDVHAMTAQEIRCELIERGFMRAFESGGYWEEVSICRDCRVKSCFVKIVG